VILGFVRGQQKALNIGNGEFFSNAKRQDPGGASPFYTQGCAKL
jgi:hypothetical protein